MRAIRAQRAGQRGVTAHWLVDDELTCCGRDVDDMNVIEDLDLEELPLLEACGGCVRCRDGFTKPEREYIGLDRWGAPLPAPRGRISRTGKLRQSGRSGHGSRL